VFEISKFSVAFVLGLIVSVVAYKLLGVPHFLGAPGEWRSAPSISVRLETPFTPVAQDQSYYGPALCGATVKVENHYNHHPVSVSFFVVRKGKPIATAPGQDSYGQQPQGGGYDDESGNGYNNNGGSNGNYDPQYGGAGQDDGGYGQDQGDNIDPSDTPYGFDIKPDETERQIVKLEVAQDDYGRSGSCEDLNRRGAVQLQLSGCAVEGVSDPKDADCGPKLHSDF
jgi:hypothetical protein